MAARRWIGLGAAIAGVGLGIVAARSRNRRYSAVSYDSAATRVLILGGGFAGLNTARTLAGHFGSTGGVAIRLVDQADSLTFWPMVPEVIPGTIQAPHVLRSLRELLVPLRVEFVRGQVTDIDLERKQVRTGAGEMSYDKLVLALGWQTAFFAIPGAAQHCLTLQSLRDAVAIRSRVVDRFETATSGRGTGLQFLVVGGGSSGVEVAAGMAELIDLLMPQYPQVDEREVCLTVIQATDDILPDMEEPLRKAAASRLHRDRIVLRTDSKVSSVDAGGVLLENGDRLEASTVIWAAGVEPNSIAHSIPGASLDSHGRLEIDDCLRVVGQPGVYALGDIAAVRSGGNSVAPTAQAAVQEAAAAAHNLAAEVMGGALRPFRYRDMGRLVDLGGRFAVSQVLGTRLSGMAGHLLWRGVYLYKLGDWRDRLHVITDWTIHRMLPPSVPRLRMQ
jgi:NADH dehydrogenase